jgi:hypothetical protein
MPADSDVEIYLDHAEKCERLAAIENEPEVRALYSDLAWQWRALARQTGADLVPEQGVAQRCQGQSQLTGRSEDHWPSFYGLSRS